MERVDEHAAIGLAGSFDDAPDCREIGHFRPRHELEIGGEPVASCKPAEFGEAGCKPVFIRIIAGDQDMPGAQSRGCFEERLEIVDDGVCAKTRNLDVPTSIPVSFSAAMAS